MRRLFIGIIIGIFGLLSIGKAVYASEEKEELVVWMWTAHVTDLYQEWYEKFTRWFEEKNPGATVRFEFEGTSGQKLIASVATGTPPDVSLVRLGNARAFYEAGMFTDLTPYIETTPSMAVKNFLPSAIESSQKDGVQYGMPWSLEAKAIHYNVHHFIEAGLDPDPRQLATWDDLERAAKSLVRKDGGGHVTRSGFINQGGTSTFLSYLYSNGGRLYNEDYTGVELMDPKALETLEFMHRIEHEWQVKRPGAVASATMNDLMTHSGSMAIGDTSSVPYYAQVAPDYAQWLGMVPIPQGPQGIGMGGINWSNMFVIPVGAEKPDLAWKFIQLWLSPEVSVQRFLHWGGANVNSPRLEVLKSKEFQEAAKQYTHLQMATEIFNTAGPYPLVRYSELNGSISPLLRQVLTDNTLAPSAALEEATRIGNAILGR